MRVKNSRSSSVRTSFQQMRWPAGGARSLSASSGAIPQRRLSLRNENETKSDCATRERHSRERNDEVDKPLSAMALSRELLHLYRPHRLSRRPNPVSGRETKRRPDPLMVLWERENLFSPKRNVCCAREPRSGRGGRSPAKYLSTLSLRSRFACPGCHVKVIYELRLACNFRYLGFYCRRPPRPRTARGKRSASAFRGPAVGRGSVAKFVPRQTEFSLLLSASSLSPRPQ